MRRDLCTVVQLGFAFFTIFSAFNSQGFIEITVLRNLAHSEPATGLNESSGYYSLAIIYFVFTFSNLLAPPFIKILGSKWSQVVGAICYTSFMLAFLHLNVYTLYIFSAVLGFGAAVLWTGNGVYLVEMSREGKMARNSGIMWAMLQSSLVAGSVFLLYVLRNGDLTSSYRLVYTVFSVGSAVGVLTLICLPSTTPEPLMVDGQSDRLIEEDMEAADGERLITAHSRTWREEFSHTFLLLKSYRVLNLSICFLYSGLETTFYTGVYSACLSAATALNKGSEAIIPYNAFCMGIGQIIGGLTFGMGFSATRLSRSHVIILGTILHLTAFFLCFINIPMESPLHKTSSIAYMDPSFTIALLTGFCLGLADACWNTQIYTLISAFFKTDASSGFALFKFFQSLAACISFYYGSVLLLHWQLLILAIGAVLAALSFFATHNELERLDAVLS